MPKKKKKKNIKGHIKTSTNRYKEILEEKDKTKQKLTIKRKKPHLLLG